MKKTYISTSIAYINAEPHIGFLFELLAADVLARYHKFGGDEVFFLTGTDEHGVKVFEAAKAAGQSPQEWADKTAGKFEALGKQFDIDFDYFIRTTDQSHKKFVQEKWQQLSKAGLLAKKKYTGLYCTGCEALKRGEEIVEGKCAVHEVRLEEVEEENYFLKIRNSKLEIRNWIKGAVYPETRRQEVLNVLESGSYDEVSVSRPKAKYGWGVEVPGDPGHIMYVWVDALFNYLSGIELSGRKIDEVWPADIQIIGKDILKFHAIIWPALLLATGYELPKKLLVHGFINVEGKKLSKSTGHIVYPRELLERYSVAGEFAADACRYLLCRQLNFYEDSNFSWEDFDRLYSGELSNGIGNLLSRTVGLAKKVNYKPSVNVSAEKLLDKTLGKLDFHLLLETSAKLARDCDQAITSSQLWVDTEQKLAELKEVVDKLLVIAGLLEPVMPKTAKETRRQLQNLSAQPIFPRRAE